MRPVAELPVETCRSLRGVFSDIDDTLTWEGKLVPEAFQAMDDLRQAGLRMIPITGRPGGWVDQIARTWPVDGVVGENGGLWFYLHEGKMVRSFLQASEERRRNRERLTELGRAILERVPGTALASDQPYRDLDLAIDFCEDVPPLDEAAIDQIVSLFEGAGASAKVSSIHVNGWYGTFDKLSGCRRFLRERFDEDLDEVIGHYAFFGDSANDEPMFRAFPTAIGVANVQRFLPRMTARPAWVTRGNGGHGFAEAVRVILGRRG
jgi:HAD superfamily hydrolase (TIGR01484 family)